MSTFSVKIAWTGGLVHDMQVDAASQDEAAKKACELYGVTETPGPLVDPAAGSAATEDTSVGKYQITTAKIFVKAVA